MINFKGPERGEFYSKNDSECLRNSGDFSVERWVIQYAYKQTYLMLKCVKLMHRRNISIVTVNKWFILRIASGI